MLDEFYEFVRAHPDSNWLGWIMRDTKFGFPHIEHRHRVLGGTPADIDDDRKINLGSLLVDLYGPTYVAHPRLITLMRLNGISELSFLSGDAEPVAFAAGEYVRLHQSTLRKVDNIAYIFERVLQRRLKTSARFCVVDDALLPEIPTRYWHCAAWNNKDESAIENDLTLEDIERKIAIPWRAGQSFIIGGMVFQSKEYVKRILVKCTADPVAHFEAIDVKQAAERRARDEAEGAFIDYGYVHDSRFSALHSGDDHTSRLLFESIDLHTTHRSLQMANASTDPVNKTGSILFLDIVGWSKLSASEIRSFVEKALPKLGEIAKKRRPWMMNTWGDAIVAVFDSATTCSETALELCEFFNRAKASDGVAPGMAARVGAHIGEVFQCTNPITTMTDIFGPAVHIAARLEPVAAAGHAFCTSDFANRLTEVHGEAPRAYRIGEIDLAKGFGRQEIFVLAWPNAPAPHIERFQVPIKPSATASAFAEKFPEWLKSCRRPFNSVYGLIDGSNAVGSLNSAVAFFSNFSDGTTLEVCKVWHREVSSRLRELERWGLGIQAVFERESGHVDLVLADLGRWLKELIQVYAEVAAYIHATTDSKGMINTNAKRQLAAARDEMAKQFEKIADAHHAAYDTGLTTLPLAIPRVPLADN